MKKHIMKFELYEHIKTGKEIKACKFRHGMQDGIDHIKGKFLPFIKCKHAGYIQKIYVTENDYIVLTKSFSKKKNKNIEHAFIFNGGVLDTFYRKKD